MYSSMKRVQLKGNNLHPLHNLKTQYLSQVIRTIETNERF